MTTGDNVLAYHLACNRLADAARACAVAIDRGRNLKARLEWLRKCSSKVSAAQRRLQNQQIDDTLESARIMLDVRLKLLAASLDVAKVRAWIYAQKQNDDVLADRLLGLNWNRARDPILLFGEGTENVVKALQERGQKRIIVCDKNARPMAGVIAIQDVNLARAAVLSFMERRPTSVQIHCYGDAIVPDADRDRLNVEVQEALDTFRLCQNTIDTFGQVWIDQGIRNLPVVCSVPRFEHTEQAGCFNGCPMVIIASGPSLSKNIHQVAALKGKALLVTFSHSIGALQRAGIVPDMVLALDPEDLRYHFCGFDTSQLEALMIGATVHHEVLRLPCKRLFTFAANAGVDGWIYKPMDVKGQVETGGSVACTALSMAIHWGCSEVVLIGQDLAYTGNKVYADGISDDAAKIEIQDGKFQVKGWSTDYANMRTVNGATETFPEPVTLVKAWDGVGEVATSFIFGVYRKWIEQALTRYPIKVYNCTEGGSWIEGTDHVPLSEVVPRLLAGPDLDVGSHLDRAMALFDRPRDQAAMHARLKAMLADVTEAHRLASRCDELANCSDFRPPAELRECSNKLESYMLRLDYLVIANQSHLREQDEIEIDDQAAWNQAARENYKQVVESGARLTPLLEGAIRELEGKMAQ